MRFWVGATLVVLSGVFLACGSSSGDSAKLGADASSSIAALSRRPKPSPSPSPTSSPSSAIPVALLFDGTGTSDSDFQALAAILQAHGITYQAVTSLQLEAMSASDLAGYKLIVWPGGDSIVQNDNLAPHTRERVREAVVNSGVNFVGFCAGAFIAVGPPPPPGGTPYWGLSIANYNYLTVFYPNGPGTTLPVASMEMISFANGTSRDLVWWDGPFLPAVSSGVLAKYPDGTPAMVALQSGQGFVVLSGVHPEAPQSWRDRQGLLDIDGLDTDIAWNLINGALTRTRLSVF